MSRPRAHLACHGILAPDAAYRDDVVPRPDPESRTGPLRRHRAGLGPPPDEDEDDRRRRLSWAELLQRVFHINALVCPYCGAKHKLIATITCLSAVARRSPP